MGNLIVKLAGLTNKLFLAFQDISYFNNADPLDQVPAQKPKASDPAKRANEFVKRLSEGQEYAQAAMASIQQRMESSANKNKSPQEKYCKGDHVWLNLKNICTPQLSKKLSWVNAKYRVIKVIIEISSGDWKNYTLASSLIKRYDKRVYYTKKFTDV